MKAIVMAGGEGSRLRPLTCSVPKPMVTLLDKPMIEFTVEHLKRHRITELGFTLMYKPDVITHYFEDYPHAEIEYFMEDTPLGTAGSVKNAAGFVDGGFIVISGDALTDIDIAAAAQAHRESGAMATIVLKKMGSPLEYGVVIAGEEGKVQRFVEKPGWEDVFSDTVNTGIYILEKEALDLIPEGQMFDFAKDLFPKMMEAGIDIHGYVADGYWCDVGSAASYIKAHEDMLSGAVRVDIPGQNVNGIYVGKGADISSAALIQSPGFIGAGARIGDGAKIGRFSAIGKGAVIGSHANIKRSVLLQNVRVGRMAKLSGCVAADGAHIGGKCSVYEGAVIGAHCKLEDMASVSPRVKLWPHKWLGRGAKAGENIVWGDGERTGFLGRSGFSGEIGTDVTALRLSRIFGAAAEYASGGCAAVGCDGSAASRAAADIAAGVFAMNGCDVYVMHDAARPVCAHMAQALGVSLCVCIKAQKQGRVYVDMFEPRLMLLTKQARKKIEARYFAQGEALRGDGCGSAHTVGAVNRLYIQSSFDTIDHSAIAAANICVLVRGGKDVDDLAAKAFEVCGIRVKRLPGDRLQDISQILLDENAHFGVRFARSAAYAALALPGGRELDKSEFEALVYYLIMSDINTAEVKLPSSAPLSAAALAQMMNLPVAYTSRQEALESYSAQNRRMLFDAVYAVCRLAQHIAHTGASLEDIAAMISPPHIRVSEVACGWEDIGRVIRTVYETGRACASEGLRMDEQNGYGYICPHENSPKIVIRTEGHTEEFAEELCAKYTGMVKDILKK